MIGIVGAQFEYNECIRILRKKPKIGKNEVQLEDIVLAHLLELCEL